jgi:hypothetical protein
MHGPPPPGRLNLAADHIHAFQCIGMHEWSLPRRTKKCVFRTPAFAPFGCARSPTDHARSLDPVRRRHPGLSRRMGTAAGGRGYRRAIRPMRPWGAPGWGSFGPPGVRERLPPALLARDARVATPAAAAISRAEVCITPVKSGLPAGRAGCEGSAPALPASAFAVLARPPLSRAASVCRSFP